MKEWTLFLGLLEREFGQKTIDQWLRNLVVLRFDARNLYLEIQNPLQIAWFEEQIRPRLKNGFVNNNGIPIAVHLSSAPKKEFSKEQTLPPPFLIHADRMDPELTFEHFLNSPANTIAYQLLSEIDRPTFNPIYLYGPKNSGKTHLLTAAALSLQKKGKKVFFVRAETFTSHVVQAIRLGQMQQFRKVYRDIDALFIDGLDIFSKKAATQEEFFHTFNTLHTLGKPIVLTASTAPSKLTEIEPRLISRFEWGLSIPLEMGNTEDILQKKATLWKLSLSTDIISFLARAFPKNPLLALQALSLRVKGLSSLTIQKTESLLQDLLIHEQNQAPSPEKIIKAIASHYGIRDEDIIGKSQTREMAQPRQLAMFLCRTKLNLPFQKIGEIFGRDHSTVMSSIRQIQKNIDEKKPELLTVLKELNESK